MGSDQLKTRKDYEVVMKQIEALLQKSTQIGGFDKLPKEDADTLESLSLLAEQYEDSIPLMPIKTPSTLTEMIRYKMFEMNLKQKQLAKILEISEARISELLTGKRKINIELAKKLHSKLNIDAHFILEVA
ncbi:MAG: helix-turn-helix domain-containing protein [Flavobacteriia bacterium]|nr:helix-turn-helix domain-containing protein [Flavobacteriia bacterium]